MADHADTPGTPSHPDEERTIAADEDVQRPGDGRAEAADEPAEAVGDPTEPVDGPAEAAGEERSREELLDALHGVEAARDEYLRDLQRVQAEFDNYRKRMMRAGGVQRDSGVADVVGRLLDVLDDFDLAVLSVDGTQDIRALHKGLELVYSKLVDTLKGFGLTRIDEEGVPFDPERHEAVQSVEAEGDPHDEPMVVDVLRPGYELGGRVLRAAMVKVAR